MEFIKFYCCKVIRLTECSKFSWRPSESDIWVASCGYLSWESHPRQSTCPGACLSTRWIGSLKFKANLSILQVSKYSFFYSILVIQLFNVWVSPLGTNNLEEDAFTGCQFDQAGYSLKVCIAVFKLIAW